MNKLFLNKHQQACLELFEQKLAKTSEAYKLGEELSKKLDAIPIKVETFMHRLRKASNDKPRKSLMPTKLDCLKWIIDYKGLETFVIVQVLPNDYYRLEKVNVNRASVSSYGLRNKINTEVKKIILDR